MNFISQSIPEVLLIEPIIHKDIRGYFVETFKQALFDEAIGYKVSFVQDNESKSISRGVLRGLHFQSSPHTQGKLVRVISGKVLDVAVDIRRNSKTFGQHVAIELSEENKKPIKFSFEEGGTEYSVDDLNDEQGLLYNKLGVIENRKNELVGNANFEVEILDMARAGFSTRLKESLEGESVIEVAE